MLAPRSMRVLPTNTSPIDHGMVTLPGSLNFCGRIVRITGLQFPSTMMLSLLMYFPFLVSKSFRNLVYKGICYKTSPNGMVKSIFLKMSRKRGKYHSFISLMTPRDMGLPSLGLRVSTFYPPMLIDSWSF